MTIYIYYIHRDILGYNSRITKMIPGFVHCCSALKMDISRGSMLINKALDFRVTYFRASPDWHGSTASTSK